MKTKPFHHAVADGCLFLSAYSEDRPRPVLICNPEDDRTDQFFREECDINTIMKQYESYGVIDHLNRLEPQWADVPEFDYRESVHLICEAEAKFGALPAILRARFDNDPHAFLEFFNREENRAEGEKLGLLVPRAPAPTAPTPPTPPAES